MGTIVNVMVAAFNSMINVFLVSLCGFLLSLYPKRNPLLPTQGLKVNPSLRDDTIPSI